MKRKNRLLLTFTFVLAILLSKTTSLLASTTIEHRWGETLISHPPTKIVSLSFTGLDSLLALDVEPIAYRTWFGGDEDGLWPWTRQKLQNTSDIRVLRGEINSEEVARMKPDFIEAIYSGISRAQYKALSRVSPVLPSSEAMGDFGTNWVAMLQKIGKATGRSGQAEQIISSILTSINEIRKRHPDWQGKTAIVAQPNGPLIFSEADPRMALITRLGFQMPKAAKAYSLGNFYFKLDKELTAPLEADVIIWLGFGGNFSVLDTYSLLSKLRANHQIREVFLDLELSAALSYSSPLSIPYVLKRIEPMLDAALSSSASQTSASEKD